MIAVDILEVPKPFHFKIKQLFKSQRLCAQLGIPDIMHAFRPEGHFRVKFCNKNTKGISCGKDPHYTLTS